jgi:hypothetical protein
MKLLSLLVKKGTAIFYLFVPFLFGVDNTKYQYLNVINYRGKNETI